MIKNERVFTLKYTGGAPAGAAVLYTDGSLVVQTERGLGFVIEGVAQAVLEEHAAYLAWREEQGGTPGRLPGECNHLWEADETGVRCCAHCGVTDERDA
jgi:hypothetical protein